MNTLSNKFSPIALLLASIRALSGLPHSDAIADTCQAGDAARKLLGSNTECVGWLATAMTQQYNAVEGALRRTGFHNILHLSPCLSPLGLAWSANSQVTFVEADVHDVVRAKRGVVRQVLGDHWRRPNLKWSALDVVEAPLDSALTLFDDEPVAVVSGWRIPCLSREQQVRAATNIHAFLSRTGGVWVTPVITKEQLGTVVRAHPSMAAVFGAMSGLTSPHLRSDEKARRFFDGLNFRYAEPKNNVWVLTPN